MVARLRLLSAVALTIGAAPAERDWGATLRQDARALHDDIATNHPGPVNRADPGFASRNDAQLALAFRRAQTTRRYADYYHAMRAYAASFDDGHLDFSGRGRTPLDFRWPGLLTAYDGRDRQRVTVSEEPAVPVGARLVGCDGLSADRVAAQTIGRTEGRWFLRSQRLEAGHYLLIDMGNRYVARPRRCSFAVDGHARTVTLNWRSISFADLGARLPMGAGAPTLAFGTHIQSDGTRWYGIPSFDGNPASRQAAALRATIAGLRDDRDALARAPAIVLDLRGNTGGSSDWARQIAVVLWGEAAVARVPDSGATAEFRVSRTNLAVYQSYGENADGMSPEWRRIVEETTRGLSVALARGEQLWRRTDRVVVGLPDVAPPQAGRLRRPIYFVTDSRCVSACLDAVDLWRALGAIHLGDVTSADTLYMEAPKRVLPSGLGVVSIPMKVFRDRPRGSNVPVVPVHRFGGDINDTPALERWIAALPERRR